MMQKYHCTTLSFEFKNWGWYREYRNQVEAEKTNAITEPSKVLGNEPLPINIGLDFCRWVLKTPEVSDIVYRRFVLGDYNSTLESNLLSDATSYFLNTRKVSGAGGLLSACWLSLAEILKGNIEAVDTPEFRASLLKSTFAFTETR